LIFSTSSLSNEFELHHCGPIADPPEPNLRSSSGIPGPRFPASRARRLNSILPVDPVKPHGGRSSSLGTLNGRRDPIGTLSVDDGGSHRCPPPGESRQVTTRAPRSGPSEMELPVNPGISRAPQPIRLAAMGNSETVNAGKHTPALDRPSFEAAEGAWTTAYMLSGTPGYGHPQNGK